MSKPLTATQVTAMKNLAKQRSRASGNSYNATLEEVVREQGFESWHAVQQLRKAASAAEADVFKLPLDPKLPAAFDDTPNEDRDEKELDQWWLKPFALTLKDGKFEVRCCDGGAWDRSTWYGIADDFPAAVKLAQEKLARWCAYRDTPILMMEAEGKCAMIIESSRPNQERTVLATFPDHGQAIEWRTWWDLQVELHPELTQRRIKRARVISQEWWFPERAEMTKQLAILKGVLSSEQGTHKGSMAIPDPLPADLEDFVYRGQVWARLQVDLDMKNPRAWVVTLTPYGKSCIEAFESKLQETSQD